MARASGGPKVSMAALVVVVLGVALTISTAVAAEVAHDQNEERLLRQRTREAAAVLEASIPGVEIPLRTTAALIEVVQSADQDVFESAMGAQVGPGAPFVSASVWPIDDVDPTVVVGEAPLLGDQPADEVTAFLEGAVATGDMTVKDLLSEGTPRLGYAVTAPGDGARFMVYAEAALPVDKTEVVQPDSAFEGLDYSLHLGPDASRDALIFASTAELPLDGPSAIESIPFGDTELVLAMSPTEDLGGALIAALPLIVLATGVPAALAAGALTETLQRRRRHAEGLAAENERLLGEQRTSFAAFQRSLLPREIPVVPEVEVAVRYVAGDVGTYVGGDWYDVIDTPGSIVVVVGDVSGRGLAAASAMAAMRHTIATLATMGLSPDEVLTRAAQLAVRDEAGHFATVVLAALDRASRTLTVASAGHPPPLVASDGDARWMDLTVGPPIGFGPPTSYRSTTAEIADDAVILLVTDGLYERRDETIDEGMERLRRVSGSWLRGPGGLDPSIDRLIDEMTGGAASDDTAAVAIRWRP